MEFGRPLNPLEPRYRELVRQALRRILRGGDITQKRSFPRRRAPGTLIANLGARLQVDVALEAFAQFDPSVAVHAEFCRRRRMHRGAVIGRDRGSARALLTASARR